MKQLIFIFALLVSITTQAYDLEQDGIYYNITSSSDKTVEVTRNPNSYTGSVNIPNSVNYNGNNYCVTSIGVSAFNRCSGLTSVTIPNSVTSIGDYAFYYCSGLTSLTIPESVTSIGYEAFSYCSSLTSVIIPESVTSIGNYAFYYCSGLTSVTIPNSVTSIGSSAFQGCSGLTSLIIGSSVTSIGSGAFYGCTGLEKVIVPDIAAWCTIIFGSNPLYYAHHLYSDENTEITDLTIPKSVTSIESSAFQGCSGLTSITIPNSVTSIGNQAFEDCTGLVSVTIPNNVTSIGNSAFSGCSGLTSVTIPNSVTSIGYSAFSGCSGLTSVTIPNSVTSIGLSAFSGCTGLTSITIPNSVTSIGSSAFSGCSGLTSVTIGNSVTSIGRSAFSGCTGLTSVTIPNSVTSIGDEAFYGCSGLTSMTIPYSVTSIGSGAFSGTAWYNNQPDGVVYAGKVVYKYKGTMPSGTAITLKDGTLGIAGLAFYDCIDLTSVTIPNSVTSIGSSAFSGCTGLTSVTIPNSVTTIRSNTFRECSGLMSITIPSSVTSIGDYAFCDCYRLTSVTIPENVKSIGEKAFASTAWYDNQPDGVVYAGKVAYKYKGSMPYGTSITLKDGTLGIAGSAFYECSSLTSVTIPEGVTSIGGYAFFRCSGLTSVTIPNSVTSIGYSAFSQCSFLTSVISLIENPFTLDNAFNSIHSTCVLIVPNGTRDVYIAAGWTENTFRGGVIENDNIVEFQDMNVKALCIANWDKNGNGELEKSEAAAVTDLGRVFQEKTNMTSFDELQYFTGLTSIGRIAFSGCSGLTSVTIPNSVTSIGDEAFFGCSSLTSVTIPNSVTSIGGSAFEGCTGLTSVTIPNSVTSIGGRAFEYCLGLTSVTIPNSVTSIGAWAFSYCSALASIEVEEANPVYDSRANCNAIIERATNTLITGCKNTTIPNSVTSIGKYAFYNCSGLTSVTIPNSVTNIGNSAFYGCSSFTSVTIPSSVTSIGDYAFRYCSALASIEVEEENPVYDSRANCNAIIETTTNTLILGCKNTIIPNSVTSIGSGTFAGCSSLTSVTIPNSVTSIGSGTFAGCSSLTSVTIPNSVTSIGNYAFNNCSGLTSVISQIENPFLFGNEAFTDISSSCVLTVPNGTRDAYIAAGWTEEVFKGGILVIEEYLSIEDVKSYRGAQKTFPVAMMNEQPITAFQFEVELPEGVSLTKCELTYRKKSGHVVSFSKKVGGNSYQVTAISLTSEVFSGTSGPLVNLTLDVSKSQAAGDYTVSIKNIELTSSDAIGINPADISATLTVTDVLPGDTNGDGKVTITDAVAIVNYILGSPPANFVIEAADVNQDGKVSITDAVAIVNKILAGETSVNQREMATPARMADMLNPE